MGHVDWGALTYQRPSVLSSGSRSDDFMDSFLVIAAFLALLKNIKFFGKSEGLYFLQESMWLIQNLNSFYKGYTCSMASVFCTSRAFVV